MKSCVGRLELEARGGSFLSIEPRPRVVITEDTDPALAADLHAEAHERCFIARSCRTPITVTPNRRSRGRCHRPARDDDAPEDVALRLESSARRAGSDGRSAGRRRRELGGRRGLGRRWPRRGALFIRDAQRGAEALTRAGIAVEAVRPVVALRLVQGTPGQLGHLTLRMAGAGVNIEALSSDHDHRLILVVDDIETARREAQAWRRAVSQRVKLSRTRYQRLS